jgi:integrase/recombinase XerD
MIMTTPLRTQFLDYMTVQRFTDHTKRNYIRAVQGLAKFYNQSPDTLTNDQIQEYFRHLLEDLNLSWGTCNNYFSGIVSFYKNICKWDETKFKIPPRPRIKKLPVVYSLEEVKRLFAAVDNLKHLVLLETAYSAGLRINELVHLKPHHIESDPSRMLIRVEQGKGNKDRYTILSHKLLKDLRSYWSQYRPEKWLFTGQKPENHLTTAAVHRVFTIAKKKPESTKALAFIRYVTASQPICSIKEQISIPLNDSSVMYP